MSSSQVYPTVAACNAESMNDMNAGITSAEWYAPSSYAYHDPSYMTPYPTSTMDSQPWTQYARSSVPDIPLAQYAMPNHYMQHQLPTQHFMRDPQRPRSSPSTFGPSADLIQWPIPNGLGIYPNGPLGHPTPPITSTFPPNAFQVYPTEEQYGKDDLILKSEQYSTASPPEIKQPQPKRPYPSIAPNPEGSGLKRQRDDDEPQPPSSHQKKRKRTSSVVSDNLGEDDQFLVKLKEEEALPWKDIAARFQTDKNKTYNVAALQMKYKRLREKFRIWEEQDLVALRMAVEFWERNKWEIVSAKMLDFGLHERWAPKQCQRKWDELGRIHAPMITGTAGITPALSQFSSPIEAPSHFAFLPLH